MSESSGCPDSSGTRRRRGARWIAVAAVTAVAALGIAASASAATSYTATVAPIGSGGSYLLSIQNTGSEAITSVFFSGGEKPTNIVPSGCTFGNTPVAESINCSVNVAPGGTLQICYTGAAVEELVPGTKVFVNSTPGPAATVAAVSSCPVAGFKSGSSGETGGKCVVPKVVGKTEAAALKALTAAHCGLGKVKKAKSSKVKKGKVISQATASGKSLASGSKIGLTVSKGK
jgi:hypothetical protein